MLKSFQKHLLIGSKPLLLIAVGSITWSLTMVKSGVYYGYGIGFWGPNGHDGVWHISLINSLSKGSLEMPIFAGEQIKNYHIGFDLLLAIIHKVTSIPASILYFQILPVVLSLGIGVLLFRFVKNWTKSENAALWSLFFVYFGGNFGWLVTLFRSGEIGGESVFWSQQAISTLINPPYALSILILLIALNLMLRKKLNIVVLGILFGLLLPIKAYAGVLALGSLFIVSIWQYLSEKSTLYLKVFFVAFLTSLVLFLPLNQGSGGLIELKPFWFLETMMSFPDRVSWQRFGEAMVNYKTGGNIVKAFAAYFVSFAIFIVGNFGTRLFGIRKRKIDNISIFLILILLGGIAANLLFVQKGTAWNTIQFFYYSLFVGSIFAGIAVSEIKKYKALFWTGIVLLTIPTTYATLRHYLPMRPPAMISAEEVRALAYLSNQPKGTALVMPFDRNRAEAASYAPRPLYLYESTSYVSAYSRHSVWLEDEVNLDITDFNWQARREELLEVLKSNNQTEMGKFLEKYKISYVYDVTNNPIFIGLDLVYNEDNFKIYRVSS